MDYSGELDFDSAKKVIDDITAFANPILVLTGGEPLYRHDIFDIARYAASKPLRVALATNGTLIDEQCAQQIQQAGIARASISIDGSTNASHDDFRGIPGAFDAAVRGARLLREQGVAFQFNTTVTKRNVGELEDILQCAINEGAAALHFLCSCLLAAA